MTDILERLNARLNDIQDSLLAAAIEEIEKLRMTKVRRGKLLSDIFNDDTSEMLPMDIKNRIDDELMGRAEFCSAEALWQRLPAKISPETLKMMTTFGEDSDGIED
ncbi:MAG: hypothetical protein CVV05_01525 [Gammaproteobacteria bacterium HGW-Gammaproteobacteria-1]|nr:MAG: hypothetical protein CVV05_01525 [Gammaproteobacteria bacterium HGW-Gammaproteobacteria-1]